MPKQLYSVFFFWLFWGVFIAPLKAQEFAFQHYTVKDGLPSMTIYNLLQDKEGYIWLATESGISKFDSQNFSKSSVRGLNQKEIINLCYDDKFDRLWMIDIANNVYYLEQGKLNLFNNQESIFPKPESLLFMRKDLRNRYWFFSAKDNIVRSIDTEYINDVSNFDSYTLDTIYKKVYHAVNDSLSIIFNGKQSIHFTGKNSITANTYTLEYPPNIKYISDASSFNNQDENIIALNKYKILNYSIEANEITKIFEEYNDFFTVGLNSIFIDNKDNIWISSADGLLLFLNIGNGAYRFSKHLKGNDIGRVIQDHKNGYWIATLNEGLFYLPYLDIKIKKFSPNKRVSIAKYLNNGEIIVGKESGVICKLDSDFKEQKSAKLKKGFSRVYDIKIKEDNIYYFLSDSSYVSDYNLKVKGLSNGSFKIALLTASDTIWYGASYEFGYINNKKRNQLIPLRTYTIYEQDQNHLWIGTVKGLFLFKDNEFQQIDSLNLPYDIRDITMSKDSILFLATQGNGVILYKNNKILQHYTTDNGLTSNNCTKFLLDENHLWIGTNRGLNKLNITTNEFYYINTQNGLPDNNINFIDTRNDTLLISTDNGIAYFRKDIKIKETPPEINITDIKINEIDTILQTNYDLSYNENNLQIEYNAISYGQNQDIKCQYKIDQLYNQWIETSLNQIQYPSLPPGYYNFLIRSKSSNSDWSNPVEIGFTIQKPFWSRWWFLLFVFFSCAFIIYHTINNLIKRLKKEAALSQQLKVYQLTALRSQMNPHFMYNSLNSIQEYIMIQDKKSANKYLGRFSKLMRTILNMSDKENVSLEDEVDALNLYLELEALRFEEGFEYKITLDEKIDKDEFFIPPMLIQPFVENAIVHGLQDKTGSKLLKIDFKLKGENFIVCTIEDNGVGRKRAAEIKANNPSPYPSKAINLTQKRLDLLHSTYQNVVSSEMIDLFDQAGQPKGTKVILNIRVTFYKANS